MNKKHAFLLTSIVAAFCAFLFSQNVYADGWITGAAIEAHNGTYAAFDVHDGVGVNELYARGGIWGLQRADFACLENPGCTLYRIRVDFGPNCEGRCELVHPHGVGPANVGHGECATPGADWTSAVWPGGTYQINDSRNDQNYEYYFHTLHGNGQDIRFVFRRKRIIPPRFEGQVSSFSSKTSQSTGFTTGTKTITQSIDCSPECSVRFEMDLRRQANTGTNDSGTYWVLERETKNMSIGTRRTWSSPYYPDPNHLFDFKPSPSIALGNHGSRMRTQTYGGHDVNTGEYLPPLHPGELLCESLYFGDGNGNSKLKACIFTKDVKKPEFKGQAGLNLYVRNNDTDVESNDLVYAKPQDSITYRAEYQSEAQRYANDTSADKVRVNGTTRDNKDGRPLSSFLSPWRNGFNISGNNFYKNYTYPVGDSKAHVEINSYAVSVNDVGKEMKENASTNANGSVSTTPKNVTTQTEQTPVYLENNGRTITEYLYDLVASIDTGTLSDDARVRVPYNFRLESTVLQLPNDIYYAGEEGSFRVSLAVKTRWNSVTRGEYATKVQNSKWQLTLCPEGVSPGNKACYSREYTDPGTMNSSGSMSGGSPISRTPTISIPDDAAGSRYCLYSRIYPSDSGYDTNLSSSGSGTWSSWSNQNSSSRRCFTIAKKPSIQIWGGTIYSAGKINTSISKKNNLNGVYGYEYNINGTSSGGYRIFGSWGENGVISGGATGFSSGVSMGYGNNNDAIRAGAGNTVLSLGGSNQTDFCKRVPLSFANVSNSEANSCINAETILGIGSNSIMEVAESQKNDIISKLIGNVTPYWTDSALNGGMPLNGEGSNVFYNYSNGGNLSIGGNNKEALSKGRIRVFAVRDGNINIDKNLTYESGPYATLEEVPKTIIMAIGEGNNGNININCGVNRIDAMLIASGKIDTCKDVQIVSNNRISDIITASNQLKINGAIIAKALEPKRTYGAARGINSVIPAEIINYDPTLYLWGKITNPETSSTSDSTKKTQEEGELTITTQHEVAPRL